MMTGSRWLGLSISLFYFAQWLFYVFSYSMVTYTFRFAACSLVVTGDEKGVHNDVKCILSCGRILHGTGLKILLYC